MLLVLCVYNITHSIPDQGGFSYFCRHNLIIPRCDLVAWFVSSELLSFREHDRMFCVFDGSAHVTYGDANRERKFIMYPYIHKVSISE